MKILLFLYIAALLMLVLYCPVESKKKSDNCLPKDAPKKTDSRKMIPTTTTRKGAHVRHKPPKLMGI